MKRGDDEQVVAATIAAEDRASTDLSGTAFDGARMRDASDAESRQVGASGVVVEGIASGSLAARTGLRAGDMIVAVNRVPVASVSDLRRTIAEKPAIVALELIRDGGRLLLVARQRERSHGDEQEDTV